MEFNRFWIKKRRYLQRNVGSLKLVDEFTDIESVFSSTESDINRRLAKTWTAIDRLTIIKKSGKYDKIKHTFFQAVVVSILLYGCNTWTLTKRSEKKARRELHNNAVLNKSWELVSWQPLSRVTRRLSFHLLLHWWVGDGRNLFPWIDPLYPRSSPDNTKCYNTGPLANTLLIKPNTPNKKTWYAGHF